MVPLDKFFDRVVITVRSGDGGNGAVSFRREKGVPKGGPDGGRGGDGGSVLLRAEPQLSTLSAFRRKRRFAAERGVNGRGKDMYGRKGHDVVVEVAVGTEVWLEAARSSVRVADLTAAGQEYVAAVGGRGGKGNAAFVSSTQQAPYIAEKGERGEERVYRLELKLMADVGVIGKPNAGKSTLLRSATMASPKIAPYPFTTLEPQLGVVTLGWESFVLAEIPGLIEGAHLGIGLGHEFLRHATRTRALVHLVDGGQPDIAAAVREVNDEIEAYGAGLESKPQLLAVNKIDMPEVAALETDLRSALASFDGPLFFISGASGEGVPALMQAAVAEAKRVPVEPEPAAPLEPAPVAVGGGRPQVHVGAEGEYVVEHAAAERLVGGSDLRKWAALAQLKIQLDRLGVTDALERAGVSNGDTVRFGDIELEW